MSALDELPKKDKGMEPEETSEEARYGDTSHDHNWWGKTGRPTETQGPIAHDVRSGTEDSEEKGPLRGGHDDDWREK